MDGAGGRRGGGRWGREGAVDDSVGKSIVGGLVREVVSSLIGEAWWPGW